MNVREIWVFSLLEDRIFQHRLLRRIFVPKRDSEILDTKLS